MTDGEGDGHQREQDGVDKPRHLIMRVSDLDGAPDQRTPRLIPAPYTFVGPQGRLDEVLLREEKTNSEIGTEIKLTHSSTGEEGGPSAHGVDVTLWRHKQTGPERDMKHERVPLTQDRCQHQRQEPDFIRSAALGSLLQYISKG